MGKKSTQSPIYDPPRTWQLRLTALPDEPCGATHVQRMRRLLKAALRVYGFRLDGLETPKDALPAAPPDLDPCKTETPITPHSENP